MSSDTDTALQNAKSRMAVLQAEIAELDQQIKNRRAELEKAEAFVRAWHDFAGIKIDVGFRVPDTPPSTPKAKNPDRVFVTESCVGIINEAGRPMSRSELFQKLAERGIHIHGKDPEMVLSTMLWRGRDKIQRLSTGGYWPANEPLPNTPEAFV